MLGELDPGENWLDPDPTIERILFYLDPWRKETAMQDPQRKDKCYVDPGGDWLDPEPTIERIFLSGSVEERNCYAGSKEKR